MEKYTNLHKIFKKWLVKKTIYSPVTMSDYLRIVKNFLFYLDSFNVHNLNEVNTDLLIAFLQMRKNKPYSTSYINLRLAALSMFFNWAYTKRYCTQNPIIVYKRSKIDTKRLIDDEVSREIPSPVLLSLDEQQIIFNAKADESFASIRNKCIVELILASGLYAEEVTHLTLESLHLKEGYIDIPGEDEQSRRTPLQLLICKESCSKWLKMRRELLLDKAADLPLLFFTQQLTPLTKRMLYKITSQMMNSLNIDKKRIGPEILRQTAICNMLRNGWAFEDVQKYTGIKTLAILEKYRNALKQ